MRHHRSLTVLCIVPLLLLAATLAAARSAEPASHEVVSAVVDHVHDGDTLSVTVPSWPAVFSPILVRVAGIDTAEIHDSRPEVRALGAQARDWTAAHFRPGDSVTLRHVRRDKYFRLLADVDVVVDGETRDLAAELLRLGLARPYDGRGAKPW